MAYRIKEIFYSLQGEGINTGRPAVFVRFSGCNLSCPFCDTDFSGTDGPGGGEYASAHDLVSAAASHISSVNSRGSRPFVVITGGEPALQLDDALIDQFHINNWEIAIETNGTLPIPDGIDWITVSPKAGADLVITSGTELKLLYPQKAIDPASFEHLDFDHLIIQPIDETAGVENLRDAIHYCLAHPRWRLGIQLHKILGIK
ncbi:MAG: 7-cyano-7-deazaguanine reductase [Deltaproteobacteria bacterium]|nr:7-cyano-7-deazaguanine reductase [Deltaproteobacteria bacterium]